MKEIFADTGYLLGTNSLLFAILVNHINEDKVEISFDDFNNKRLQFFNCGRVCYFDPHDIERDLNNSSRFYIQFNGYNKWIIDMNKLFDNFINRLSKEELRMFEYKESYAKIYYLYYFFDIDERIFPEPDHAITSLLKCNWMFNIKDEYEYLDSLFDQAKLLKPDGNNIEWLKIMKELQYKENVDDNYESLVYAYK